MAHALEPAPLLSARELDRIIKLVYERSGITLHEGKRELVIARLQKRLRALGHQSFGEYISYAEGDPSGQEIVTLLDAIATNHTQFFREASHFDFIIDRIVPALRPATNLRLWSAPCSTGEEVYTMAMSLQMRAPQQAYQILGSDISTKALAAAKAGVYKMPAVQAMPREVLRRFFEKGMGEQEGLVRVQKDLRRNISFRHLNLLEITDLGERFEVIFCRNVMIYFDRAVQQRVVSMLERHLVPGGHLFISHSESLNGLTHGLQWVAPATFQRGTRG